MYTTAIGCRLVDPAIIKFELDNATFSLGMIISPNCLHWHQKYCRCQSHHHRTKQLHTQESVASAMPLQGTADRRTDQSTQTNSKPLHAHTGPND